MAQKGSSMRKIREILRLHYELGLLQQEIARGCGISQPTVHRYLDRAEAAGLRACTKINVTYIGTFPKMYGCSAVNLWQFGIHARLFSHGNGSLSVGSREVLVTRAQHFE